MDASLSNSSPLSGGETQAEGDAEMRVVSGVILAVILVLLTAAALTIWPTRYRYESTPAAVRTDRFTGAQTPATAGWVMAQRAYQRQASAFATGLLVGAVAGAAGAIALRRR